MKILVCYKELQLGVLENCNGNLLYTSNIEQEEKFQKKYILADFYKLFNSNKLQLADLPFFLTELLEMSNTQYFAEKLGIAQTDSVFERLYKIGTLNLDDIGFYIKSV